MNHTHSFVLRRNHVIIVFFSGALIGALGGLIGLGGAEFRLPLLIGLFGFVALEAVIINKAASLIVVAFALLFRTRTVPIDDVLRHWPIVANLLAGSLAGAWLGAGVATRLKGQVLHRAIAALLVLIAFVLLLAHEPAGQEPWLTGPPLIAAGIVAGFAIGVVASLLGVAGGELLIPTLMLLFGVGVNLAGSLSLAVSLPTMIAGFVRYSRDSSFAVLVLHRRFVLVMAVGSIAGAYVGALLLGVIPSTVLLPSLAAILLLSAVHVWRHP